MNASHKPSARDRHRSRPRRPRPVARLAAPIVVALALLSGPALATHPPQPGPSDRCPMCGMFVAPHPTWVAAVVFADGSASFFDGPKDMFRYLHALRSSAAGGNREAVVEVWVTDYYTTRPVDARTAHFVLGTDVLGPMGRELVPVAGAAAADTLLRDHGGDRVLTFEQVTPDDLP